MSVENELEDGGFHELVLSAMFWMVLWVLLFYFFCCTQKLWMRSVDPSDKEDENTRWWCARMLLGNMNAALVALLALPAMLVMVRAPDRVRYPREPYDIGQCRLRPSEDADDSLALWDLAVRATGLSGILFTTFTFVDIFISTIHGLGLTPDYVVHHVAFVAAGVIIRGHCIIPFNGAILLAMEASTPFLNYMLFFRNRGDRYKMGVNVSGFIFFILFILIRILVNTYGALALLTTPFSTTMPASVIPSWQGYLAVLCVSAGAAVQFFWLPRILKKFVDGCRALMRRSSLASSTAGNRSRRRRNSRTASLLPGIGPAPPRLSLPPGAAVDMQAPYGGEVELSSIGGSSTSRSASPHRGFQASSDERPVSVVGC